MSSTFQTELRERASAYATEWRPQTPDETEVSVLQTEVKRRRRGRGLVTAASAVCLVLLAAATYALAGGQAPVDPATPPGEVSPLAILGTLGRSDAVLTVREGGPVGVEDIVIVHANASAVERLTAAEVREALGPAVAAYPAISLVALQPDLSRAVFQVENPLAYMTPRVALYSWESGTTQVVDPCYSELSSIDLHRWCPLGTGPKATLEPPGEGAASPADAFVRCVGSGVQLGQIVSRACATADGMNYLYLTDLASGESSTWPLGLGELEAPLVVDELILANLTTTEGDPVLAMSGGVEVGIGGAPVRGLGVVDGRVLVMTSSDRWRAESSYGRVLGLWSPSKGLFQELEQVPLGAEDSVSFVSILR